VQEAIQQCKLDFQTTLSSTIYPIVEKPRALNRTAYRVLHMPATVVPDHSTIFSPVFRNFLVSLLNRSLMSPSRP
jgi:hypothetical protein